LRSSIYPLLFKNSRRTDESSSTSPPIAWSLPQPFLHFRKQRDPPQTSPLPPPELNLILFYCRLHLQFLMALCFFPTIFSRRCLAIGPSVSPPFRRGEERLSPTSSFPLLNRSCDRRSLGGRMAVRFVSSSPRLPVWLQCFLCFLIGPLPLLRTCSVLGRHTFFLGPPHSTPLAESKAFCADPFDLGIVFGPQIPIFFFPFAF